MTLNYTDSKPVAKTAWAKYYTTQATTADVAKTLIGDDFNDAFTGTRLNLQNAGGARGVASTVEIKDDGKMYITNANDVYDTIILGVNDNYGQTMTDSKYYLNGTLLKSTDTTIAAGQDQTLEVRNGAQSKMIYLDVDAPIGLTVPTAPTSMSVKSEAELKTALADADANGASEYTITLTDDITVTENPLNVPANATIVVPAGLTIDGTGKISNGGTIKIAGLIGAGLDDAGDLVGTGTYVLNGTSANNAANLAVLGTAATGASKIEVATNTTMAADLAMANTSDFIIDEGVKLDTHTGDQTFAGNLVVNGTLDADGDVKTAGNVTFGSASTLDIAATKAVFVATAKTLTVSKKMTVTGSFVASMANTATNTFTLTDGTTTWTTTGADDDTTTSDATTVALAAKTSGTGAQAGHLTGATNASTVTITIDATDGVMVKYTHGT